MQYPITWEDKDEFAIDIWLELGKIFHLFTFTILTSIKFSELPVSRAWIVNLFFLTLIIVFERQSGKVADTVIGDTEVAEQFFGEEADQ